MVFYFFSLNYMTLPFGERLGEGYLKPPPTPPIGGGLCPLNPPAGGFLDSGCFLLVDYLSGVFNISPNQTPRPSGERLGEGLLQSPAGADL